MVKEDVLAVASLRREVLEVAVLTYAMLLTQLLPKLAPDYVDSQRSYSPRDCLFDEWEAFRRDREGGGMLTTVAALAGLDCYDLPASGSEKL